MCGRFTLDASPEVLAEIFALSGVPDLEPRYNIAPTQQAAAICEMDEGGRQLFKMRWGLIPSWAKDLHIGSKMINARCETIHEKPAFRQAIRTRRCLIPASGFYEWKQAEKRIPHYITTANGSQMAFAGIWDSWKAPDGSILESFAIITTNANALVAPMHDRMPVILNTADFELWLNRHMTDPNKLKHLYNPFSPDDLVAWQVSPNC